MNTDRERFERVINLLPERFVDDFVRGDLWNGYYPRETNPILDEYNQTKEDLLNQFANTRISEAYTEFNTTFANLHRFLVEHFYIPNSHYGMYDPPPFYYLEPQYHHNFYMSEGGRGAELEDDERSRIWSEFKASLEELTRDFHEAYKNFLAVARKQLEVKTLWWKNPVITVPSIIGLLAVIVPVGMWLWDKNHDTSEVTVADVQYELADDSGSVIHRRTWLGNELLDADARNISKMILSIKLKNPGDSRVSAVIKNEKEIYEMPYVVDATGDFQNQRYPIPANGETGFIFGIDITPFTQLTLVSTSTENTQKMKVYDEDGNYLETVESNIVKTYGMNIPYVIEVLSDEGKVLDEFEFNVLCRAKIGELRATLDTLVEGVDGKISKSLNFECHPTFEPDVLEERSE